MKDMKEKNNAEYVASGLGAAAGSFSGSVGAKAALNQTAGTEDSSNEEIDVLYSEDEDPYHISEDPFIIEDVYGGPVPDFDPGNEPIACIYGPPPPEDEIHPDIYMDYPTDDITAD